MSTRGIACVVVGLALSLPSSALGWGDDGHRVTAAIAEARVSRATRAAIAELLDGQSLVEIATWADEIKGESPWSWAKELHYVNVPPSAEGFDLSRDCPGSGCVVSAIMAFAHTLRDPDAPREERVEALKFLVHFVADAHQPLHVGYARDRGGNDVDVVLDGQKTNLHRAWDSDLLDRAGVPWRELTAELLGEIDQAGARSDREADGSLSPAVWATESFLLVRSAVYDVPADGTLDDAYSARSLVIIRDRLRQGGVRLASLLDAIFDGERALPFAVVHIARTGGVRQYLVEAVVAGGFLVLVIALLAVRRRSSARREQAP